jgi:hypothetical protein
MARRGQRDQRHTERQPSRSGATPATPGGAGWEKHIYPGLQFAALGPEIRGTLAGALGGVGVEAEHLLALLADFPGAEAPTPEVGAAFLARLEAFAQRIIPTAAALEIATQSYLTELAASYPELRGAHSANRANDEAEPWWPAFPGYALSSEPLELRLRRCGYSYRHAVAVHLGPTLEGIGEQMALVLHALGSMPPAGVVPARALAQGLYELTDAVQGDVVPHRIRDVSPEFPGLLTAIAWLRTLSATEDTSLASDIAWARGQYEQARAAAAGAGSSPRRGFMGRLFGRSGGRYAASTQRWAESAAQEWRDLIRTLEALQASQPKRKAGA